jgi:hypothetical protein
VIVMVRANLEIANCHQVLELTIVFWGIRGIQDFKVA